MPGNEVDTEGPDYSSVEWRPHESKAWEVLFLLPHLTEPRDESDAQFKLAFFVAMGVQLQAHLYEKIAKEYPITERAKHLVYGPPANCELYNLSRELEKLLKSAIKLQGWLFYGGTVAYDLYMAPTQVPNLLRLSCTISPPYSSFQEIAKAAEEIRKGPPPSRL